jgi:hypothetical protein
MRGITGADTASSATFSEGHLGTFGGEYELDGQAMAEEDVDEAFAGHPLASRGLHPYGAFEVSHSSWIRRLEKMNSVHPRHRPEAFGKRRHLVFSFHDTTFECVCDGFEVRSARGSIESVVPEMLKLLEWSAG